MLLEGVRAEYPPGEPAAPRDAAVVLRLLIATDGSVAEAGVQSSGGEAFDDAARAAAMKLRFAPARRDGVPVAARILYRMEFHARSVTDAAGVPAVVAASPGSAAATTSTAPKSSAPPFSSSSSGAAPPSAPAPAAPVEVSVRGQSAADRLRQSAEAVKVVETKREEERSADMGDVLARTQGVSVQRSGGLGSDTRFSLNGLTDDQIRFFLDGLPLELSGYPFGISNVPVNLVERAEIYSGVVPLRFGADALGGAVNLVTDQDLRGTHAAGSFEAGSYGTGRLAVTARHLDEATGLFLRVSGFADGSKNAYPIDVQQPDATGVPRPVTVLPFHNGYAAAGGSVEAGLVDKPWARRLLVRGFATGWDRQYQSNLVMTIPYGGVSYGETALGGTIRYENVFWHRLTVSVVGGHAYTRGHFLDVASCIYDWYGRCVLPNRTTGETDALHHDQLAWEHATLGRLDLAYQTPGQAVRLNLSPTFTTRTGDERIQADPSALDPLNAQRDLFSQVLGVEYEADPFERKLQNVVFGKYYLQMLRGEEPVAGGILRRRDRDTNRFGVGDELRYRLTPFLWTKASYERATRLPRPDEVFGDDALIHANLELLPETSDNFNLGVGLDARDTAGGAFRGEVNGFVRNAKQLIVLLGNDRYQTYQNVFGARSVGVEGAAGWTSRGEYLSLDANATYQDFRNTSHEGTFGGFAGDRIPNRPWLFANAAARGQLANVVRRRDQLALIWNTHYVLGFFRSWESIGLLSTKQTIPTQLVHTAALTYAADAGDLRITSSFEVQNLTDEKVYDFYGIQRPGRTFFTKTTLEY